jgi:hypothetical protein
MRQKRITEDVMVGAHGTLRFEDAQKAAREIKRHEFIPESQPDNTTGADVVAAAGMNTRPLSNPFLTRYDSKDTFKDDDEFFSSLSSTPPLLHNRTTRTGRPSTRVLPDTSKDDDEFSSSLSNTPRYLTIAPHVRGAHLHVSCLNAQELHGFQYRRLRWRANGNSALRLQLRMGTMPVFLHCQGPEQVGKVGNLLSTLLQQIMPIS